jgi:predicted HD phosphohydrolase
MALTATIGTTVDEVLALVDELDEVPYGNLDVRTHAWAAAGLAIEAGADATLVAATLLHDIGRARYLARLAPGVPHEEVGRRFVQERFGERAGWLVGQHVIAKRYLATVDASYVAGLPRHARSALRRQGGTLSDRQVSSFEGHPWAPDAVALRRWDDQALSGTCEPAPRKGLVKALEAAWRA